MLLADAITVRSHPFSVMALTAQCMLLPCQLFSQKFPDIKLYYTYVAWQ